MNKLTRVGIILGRLGGLNTSALRFFILQTNSFQKSFEFEFLPELIDDPFIKLLASKSVIDRRKTKAQAVNFVERYKEHAYRMIAGYDLQESLPSHFIFISTAKFSDNYYVSRSDNLSIIALGNWKRYMSPPSIVEFVLTLILRESIAVAYPPLCESMHLGTKGCLCDFTPFLEDARYKALTGFICQYCSERLEKAGLEDAKNDLLLLLKREWIGSLSTHNSPASITSKLGYNLFFTKGLQPTIWESLMITFRQEGTKQLITILGAIILAALLLRLGLK